MKLWIAVARHNFNCLKMDNYELSALRVKRHYILKQNGSTGANKHMMATIVDSSVLGVVVIYLMCNTTEVLTQYFSTVDQHYKNTGFVGT